LPRHRSKSPFSEIFQRDKLHKSKQEEVVMDDTVRFRIQVEAARALAEWKASFDEQVAVQAKELAKRSGSTLITVDHYRQAAKSAIQTLTTLVQDTDSHDGREAA
jgi:hypothetical protein